MENPVYDQNLSQTTAFILSTTLASQASLYMTNFHEGVPVETESHTTERVF